MGVDNLWPVLRPVCQTVSLEELRGLRLAVDLSCWIMHSQKSKAASCIRRPYLRTLFFRTSHLLTHGVHLIFVIEGDAPILKKQTLDSRSSAPSCKEKNNSDTDEVHDSQSTRGIARRRFRPILKECQDLLDSMGVPWIQSTGEGEAMCAFLNRNGMVDGCITEDSDAFLYGATVVYKHFNMDVKDTHFGRYKMADISSKLGLDREKLVAMALLLGCDFCQGVHNVGKEKALKLMQEMKDVDIIDRFCNVWNENTFPKYDASLIARKVTHCNKCSHPGSLNKHSKQGCVFCVTERLCFQSDSAHECPCEWHKNHRIKEGGGTEREVWEKALKTPGFPYKEVIKEFLEYKDKLPEKSLKRSKPNHQSFMELAMNVLVWTVDKVEEKIVPLNTSWHIAAALQSKHSEEVEIEPVRIVKQHIQKGCEYIDVEWRNKDDEGGALIPSREHKNFFTSAFPDVVHKFEAEVEAKKAKKMKTAKDVNRIKKDSQEKFSQRSPRKRSMRACQKSKVGCSETFTLKDSSLKEKSDTLHSLSDKAVCHLIEGVSKLNLTDSFEEPLPLSQRMHKKATFQDLSPISSGCSSQNETPWTGYFTNSYCKNNFHHKLSIEILPKFTQMNLPCVPDVERNLNSSLIRCVTENTSSKTDTTVISSCQLFARNNGNQFYHTNDYSSSPIENKIFCSDHGCLPISFKKNSFKVISPVQCEIMSDNLSISECQYSSEKIKKNFLQKDSLKLKYNAPSPLTEVSFNISNDLFPSFEASNSECELNESVVILFQNIKSARTSSSELNENCLSINKENTAFPRQSFSSVSCLLPTPKKEL